MAEFLTHHRKKLFIVFLISALLMVGLCAQLGFLMIARSDHYSKMADELHKRERTIKAARGEIVDRNGTVIAANRTVCTVSVIHNQVTEPEKVIREHATIGILVTTDGAGVPEKGRKVVFQGDHPDKCGEVGGGPDHESRTLRREGR